MKSSRKRGLSYPNVYLRMRESRFSVPRQCRTFVNNKVNKNGRCQPPPYDRENVNI